MRRITGSLFQSLDGGSSMLYHALLPAGLVDRLALITFPVMLGRGKRRYGGNPAAARSWSLVKQAQSPRGVTSPSMLETARSSPAPSPPSVRAKTNSRFAAGRRTAAGDAATAGDLVKTGYRENVRCRLEPPTPNHRICEPGTVSRPHGRRVAALHGRLPSWRHIRGRLRVGHHRRLERHHTLSPGEGLSPAPRARPAAAPGCRGRR